MPKKNTIYELLLLSAEHILNLKKKTDSFPAGHNGPYKDTETPVRNTSHWLFLLAALYLKTGDNKWKIESNKVIEYLGSSQARPYHKTFHCREKKGKDRCNGLIGQAWAIEALVHAAKAFDRHDCYNLAEKVFLIHPWDLTSGIWQRVEVEGTVLTYDGTFNHQLWFAAAASQLTKTPMAQKRARIFLDKITERVQLYPNGIIFHSSSISLLANYLKCGFKVFLRELRNRLKNQTMRNRLYLKSVGYHGFNLYAFAMLKKKYPEARIWKTDNFKMLLNAHRNDMFIRDLKNSEFGFRYNLSGIEIAYGVETFFQDKKEATLWLNRQFKETFLDEYRPLSRDVPDPNTAMARIYEAARLSEEYEVTVG